MLAPDKTGFPADSDFITDDKGRKVFRNIARLSKKRVAVVADVAYEVSEGIPNRLLSDIVAASIQIQVGKRLAFPTPASRSRCRPRVARRDISRTTSPRHAGQPGRALRAHPAGARQSS